MKKFGVVVLLLVCVFSFGVFYFVYENDYDTYTEYLRIHIRADSNLDVAQNIKYEVKDAVVEFLTPLVATISTKEELIEMLNCKSNDIKQVSDNVLLNNDFDYSSTVKIDNEFFPTRDYNGLVLEEGYYDALIIELGSGQGNNWWCVLYPPLCFVNKNSSNVQDIYYQSRIVDIIKKFFVEG